MRHWLPLVGAVLLLGVLSSSAQGRRQILVGPGRSTLEIAAMAALEQRPSSTVLGSDLLFVGEEAGSSLVLDLGEAMAREIAVRLKSSSLELRGFRPYSEISVHPTNEAAGTIASDLFESVTFEGLTAFRAVLGAAAHVRLDLSGLESESSTIFVGSRWSDSFGTDVLLVSSPSKHFIDMEFHCDSLYSFEIHGGSGDDFISVNTSPGHIQASLSIDGGGGNDTISIDSKIRGMDGIHLNAEQVQVRASLDDSCPIDLGTGSILVDSPCSCMGSGTITGLGTAFQITTGGSLSTVDGNIDVSGSIGGFTAEGPISLVNGNLMIAGGVVSGSGVFLASSIDTGGDIDITGTSEVGIEFTGSIVTTGASANLFGTGNFNGVALFGAITATSTTFIIDGTSDVTGGGTNLGAVLLDRGAIVVLDAVDLTITGDTTSDFTSGPIFGVKTEATFDVGLSTVLFVGSVGGSGASQCSGVLFPDLSDSFLSSSIEVVANMACIGGNSHVGVELLSGSFEESECDIDITSNVLGAVQHFTGVLIQSDFIFDTNEVNLNIEVVLQNQVFLNARIAQFGASVDEIGDLTITSSGTASGQLAGVIIVRELIVEGDFLVNVQCTGVGFAASSLNIEVGGDIFITAVSTNAIAIQVSELFFEAETIFFDGLSLVSSGLQLISAAFLTDGPGESVLLGACQNGGGPGIAIGDVSIETSEGGVPICSPQEFRHIKLTMQQTSSLRDTRTLPLELGTE